MASRWSDVSSVHVDDFLGCGSDQMLLVFKDRGATGQLLDRFLLTDLCGISYAVRHHFPSQLHLAVTYIECEEKVLLPLLFSSILTYLSHLNVSDDQTNF